MIREIDLSSKEAYLKWVQEWKVEWNSIVEQIRKSKERRFFHRNEARRLAKQLGGWEYEEIQHHRAEMWDAYWDHHQIGWREEYKGLRQKAHELHMLRLEGKRLSWEAKQKALAEV